MATITNAFIATAAVGNREDLSDAIYNIDPVDTMFQSSVGRRSASNIIFEWQTEALANVNADNAQPEGFELSRAASVATTRASNVCQISSKDATVSGSQERANSAGRKSEMAHQMAKKAKELKRDMETCALSQQARDTGSGDNIRRTRAFGHWLTITRRGSAVGANPVSETATPTGGTDETLTEALFKGVHKLSFNAGGSATMLFTNSNQKSIIDGFTGRTNSQHNIAETKVQASVSFYASDFGNLRVVLDRHMDQQIIYGIDPEYARMVYYRPFQQKPIANIGDAETRMILAEWGVQVDNDKAHFGMFDLI
jgi:Family of unknown function (DUF5309)